MLALQEPNVKKEAHISPLIVHLVLIDPQLMSTVYLASPVHRDSGRRTTDFARLVNVSAALQVDVITMF